MKKTITIGGILAAGFCHAANLYVDANNFCAGLAPCYQTIQTAVVNALPDSDILVFPGSYAEQVDVSLMGAAIGPATDGDIRFTTLSDDGLPLPGSANVMPATGIGFTHSLPAFNGNIEITGFRITSTDDDGIDLDLVNGNVGVHDVVANGNFADGVDIEVGAGGFQITVTNTVADGNGGNGINLDGPDGTIIEVSDFQGNSNVGEGIDVDVDVNTDALTVTITNATTNNNGNVDNDSAGTVVVSRGSLTISNLIANDNEGPGLAIIDSTQTSIQDSRLERNGTDTDLDGIFMLAAGTVTVNRTFFVDNGATGIWANAAPSGAPLTQLDINCSAFEGQAIGVDLRPGLSNTAGHLFQNNNFTAHPTAAILAAVNNPNIDAMNNWWNDATGPSHALNPGGVGEQILDVDDSQTSGALGTVSYAPFLTAPVDSTIISADTIFINGVESDACQNL